MENRKERKLEDILVDAGFLTNERLEEIKHIQSKTGQKIEKLLLSDDNQVAPNRVSRDQFQVTARRMGVDYVDLESIPVNRGAIAKVTAEVARKYFVFPFDIVNNLLYLAMQNPDDIFLLDEIKIFTQMETKPYLADSKMINKAIEYFYNGGENAISNDTMIDIKPRGDAQVHKRVNTPSMDDQQGIELEKQNEQLRKLELFKKQQGTNKRVDRSQTEPSQRRDSSRLSDAPKESPSFKQFDNMSISKKEDERVVENFEGNDDIADIDAFIRNIIIKAAYINASDVHIDDVGGNIRVRYRVAGKLVKKDTRRSSNYQEITNKFKTMADIPTKKWDIPQKGRIRYEMNDEGHIFISMSTLPTASGEKILLKFGSLRAPFTIENIGFTQAEINKANLMLERKSGVIIVTGPAETGRTTTAHVLLKKLLTGEINVISIEDKIEELIDDISQIDIKDSPCNTKYDLIKLVINHDPDVILADTELDFDMLRLLFNASLSGKLIIMTMMNNTIYDTLAMLLEKGIENYTIGAALNGVIAQRIVKKVCPDCKGKNTSIKKRGDTIQKGKVVVCNRCNSSGYIGKVGVFEVFAMDPDYRNMMTKEEGLKIVGDKLKNEKSTFEENCVRLIVEEVTSIDEIIRLGFGNKLYEF